jgi:nucleoside-diphosphate-sugar epimerase
VKKIFITGGAGYVGTVLTQELIKLGYKVTVYDLLLYGNTLAPHDNLHLIKGDIRDTKKISASIKDHNIFIHLACISNDPSFELNPRLGKEINLDCFEPIVKVVKNSSINHFIYASSSSVYGIKEVPNVIESMELHPLTDYSRYKADCENILLNHTSNDLITTILRPATVCGYSSRLRLDLVVNILTNHAYYKKAINVYGGNQLRPNIHINDMVDSYILVINKLNELKNGQIYNVGNQNHSVNEIANMVKNEIGNNVKIKHHKSDDNRSYHICSNKIETDLCFIAKRDINLAVKEIQNHFIENNLKDTFTNPIFHNIKRMQELNMQ